MALGLLAALGGIVGGAAAIVALWLAVLDLRAKLWPTPPPPHPLTAPLVDIAAAIRTLKESDVQ